jgi:hypothetical protein
VGARRPPQVGLRKVIGPAEGDHAAVVEVAAAADHVPVRQRATEGVEAIEVAVRAQRPHRVSARQDNARNRAGGRISRETPRP